MPKLGHFEPLPLCIAVEMAQPDPVSLRLASCDTLKNLSTSKIAAGQQVLELCQVSKAWQS